MVLVITDFWFLVIRIVSIFFFLILFSYEELIDILQKNALDNKSRTPKAVDPYNKFKWIEWRKPPQSLMKKYFYIKDVNINLNIVFESQIVSDVLEAKCLNDGTCTLFKVLPNKTRLREWTQIKFIPSIPAKDLKFNIEFTFKQTKETGQTGYVNPKFASTRFAIYGIKESDITSLDEYVTYTL